MHWWCASQYKVCTATLTFVSSVLMVQAVTCPGVVVCSSSGVMQQMTCRRQTVIHTNPMTLCQVIIGDCPTPMNGKYCKGQSMSKLAQDTVNRYHSSQILQESHKLYQAHWAVCLLVQSGKQQPHRTPYRIKYIDTVLHIPMRAIFRYKTCLQIQQSQ